MVDKHPAEIAYRWVLRKIGAALREHGFKGSGRTWHLRDEVGVFVVSVMTSRLSIFARPRFTLLIGLGIQKLYDRYPNPAQTARPSIHQCHFIRRVGWYNAYGRPYRSKWIPVLDWLRGKPRYTDVWWEFTDDAGASFAIQEILSLLIDVALPEVLEWRDLDRFIESLKEDDHRPEYWNWLIEAIGTDSYVEPRGSRSY